MMSEIEQRSFEEIMPTVPNEPHLAFALLLDTSGSMGGAPINNLNKAINDFKNQTIQDELTRNRVDICIIEFNSTIRVVQEWAPLPQMEPVQLHATGGTDMVGGINLAIDMVKERKKLYDTLGTPCFQPWVFMITDGFVSLESLSGVIQRIQEEETKGSHGRLKFWACGVQGYDPKVLTALTRRAIELQDLDFSLLFDWIGGSISIISASRPGENPQFTDLPPNARTIPSDW